MDRVHHVAQLGAPWLLFLPQPVASVGAAVIIATQGWLVLTGNFAWLNWLTIVLAFAAIDDRVVAALVPAWQPAGFAPTPLWFTVVVAAVFALVAVLSVPAVRNLLSRRQQMNAAFNRLRLANAYGAFGTVTKRRDEVIIEGTLADAPGETDWVPYEFRGKPGDPARVPGWFAPYHLRLDWLMWFLALGMDGPWFRTLLVRLLEADAPTLRLVGRDPFGGRRPRWVRARVYRYRFAMVAERRETGLVWVRELRRTLVPPLSLDAR